MDDDTRNTELLVDEAVERVERWLAAGEATVSRRDRLAARRLGEVVADQPGSAFAMRFVDRVIRPEDPATAAGQLASLVGTAELPSFLSPLDRLLVRLGARLGPRLPRLVIPLARRRMRTLVGHLVVDSEPERLAAHMGARAAEGFSLNVNMLGEAVLGDAEAARRHTEVLDTLAQPDVDYVSVKVSAVVSQLNPWDFDGSLQRVLEALRPLLRAAAATKPVTFINLDMEEYHDLELTIEAFRALLEEPEFAAVDLGVAVQAYLPDSLEALQGLVDWHNRLVADGRRSATIKIRLVKGANLAMERVEAAVRGWSQAPYGTKAETDANYKRCLDWMLTPQRTRSVRIGVASHNLFDVAWAALLAERRGVRDSVEFELLQGMAPAQARLLQSDGAGVLLYTPAVADKDFDVAIAYLFRRLEENASEENFIHHLAGLRPGSAAFGAEAAKFRAAVADRWTVGRTPRRRQDRRRPPQRSAPADGFSNESDTDPVLAVNRQWAREIVARQWNGPRAAVTHSTAEVDRAVEAAAAAQQDWAARPRARAPRPAVAGCRHPGATAPRPGGGHGARGPQDHRRGRPRGVRSHRLRPLVRRAGPRPGAVLAAPLWTRRHGPGPLRAVRLRGSGPLRAVRLRGSGPLRAARHRVGCAAVELPGGDPGRGSVRGPRCRQRGDPQARSGDARLRRDRRRVLLGSGPSHRPGHLHPHTRRQRGPPPRHPPRCPCRDPDRGL